MNTGNDVLTFAESEKSERSAKLEEELEMLKSYQGNYEHATEIERAEAEEELNAAKAEQEKATERVRVADKRAAELQIVLAQLEAENAKEKESRVKYQDIVYSVCNFLDSSLGNSAYRTK